jgi:hypothetical protein
VSDHDYVPLSLAREYQEQTEERRERLAQARESRAFRVRAAAIAGLALVAFPFAVPGFFFLPSRGDAAILLLVDAAIGALAGVLTALVGGGAFKAMLLFALAFAAATFLLVQRHFPVHENPAAIAVLASTGLFALLVAATVGVALDESAGDS